MIRLKKAEDFVMDIVTGVERRVILRNGSKRFSNEFALAVTKQFSRASIDCGSINSSSTRAVSSCSLFFPQRQTTNILHFENEMKAP